MALIICPKCKTIISDTDEICVYCGNMLKKCRGLFSVDTNKALKTVKDSESIYEGDIKDGLRNGYGKLTYAPNDNYNRLDYVGMWKDGKHEGHGVMCWKSGQIYDGEWKNGEREGYGKLTYAPNNIRIEYVGMWKEDKREGHGVMRWTTGETYDGEWKNDEYEGHGVMRWKSGQIYDGEWKNGEMVSCSKNTYIDNDYRRDSSPKYVSPGILDNGYGPYCYNTDELVDDIINTNKTIYGSGILGYSNAKEEINNSPYLSDNEKRDALKKLDPYDIYGY